MLLATLLPFLALQSSERVLRVQAPVDAHLGPGAPEVVTPELVRRGNPHPACGAGYHLSVPEGGAYTITLLSWAFDAYLVVREGNTIVAEEDGGHLGSHARLVVELRPGVDYRVQACSEHGGKGPFRLLVEPGRPAPWGSNKRELAVEDARAGVAAMEREEGDPSPALGHALNELGMALRRVGRPQDARSVLERAMAVRSATLGEEHPATFVTVAELGLCLNQLGRFGEAQPWLESALSFAELVYGPEHPETGRACNDLAFNLEDQARYEGARDLYARALSIWEAAYGPNNIDSAFALNNLASALQKLGDFEGAEEHFERSLAIREEQQGGDSLSVATVCTNLGVLHSLKGDISLAVQYTRRAVDIRRELLPPDHPERHIVEANLGTYLYEMGRREEAAEMLRSALAGMERSVGSDSPSLLPLVKNLAEMELRLGRIAEGEELAHRAMDIARSAYGTRPHPLVVRALDGLGASAYMRRDYATGYEHWSRALEMAELVGDEARIITRLRYRTAWMAKELGAVEEAERGMRAILEEASANDNLALGARIELFELAMDRGDCTQAFARALDGFDYLDSTIDAELQGTSEASRLATAAFHFEALGATVSAYRCAPSAERARETYERVLAWKGRVSRSLDYSRELIAANVDPEVVERKRRLAEVQAELSKAYYGDEADTEGLDRLLEQRERLEEDLSILTRGHEGPRRVELAEVDAALPQGAAVIDFSFCQPYVGALHSAGSNGTWLTRQLFAFVYRQGGEVSVLHLGTEAEIDERVNRWRAALRGTGVERGVTLSIDPSEATWREANADLRRALWDPLADLVEGSRLVFVSPDRCLGGLPFEAILTESGKYLIEDHAFVYLQSPVELIELSGARGSESPSLLIVGDVDYDVRGDLDWRGELEPDELAVALPSPSVVKSRGPAGPRWDGLEGTRTELEAIGALHARYFPEATRVSIGEARATEERIKYELPRHSFVHLATHGFFKREGEVSMWDDALGRSGSLIDMDSRGRLAGSLPGLLSGLVCAGVNRESSERDDGFLTAEELAWLDLEQAELVVLSACESGLGARQTGEGMLGLRRALRRAGASTVISSLWAVDDAATNELMQSFYGRLWSDGQTRLQALRGAQLDMLERHRRAGSNGRPDAWAAFVLDGDWR